MVLKTVCALAIWRGIAEFSVLPASRAFPESSFSIKLTKEGINQIMISARYLKQGMGKSNLLGLPLRPQRQ